MTNTKVTKTKIFTGRQQRAQANKMLMVSTSNTLSQNNVNLYCKEYGEREHVTTKGKEKNEVINGIEHSDVY